MTQENLDILKLLNGCEVQSLTYENCIGIVKQNGVYVVMDSGVVVDKLDTDSKVENLFKEYCDGEGEY